MKKLGLSALAGVVLMAGPCFGASLEDLLAEKGLISKGEAGAVTSAASSKVYYKNGTRIEFPDAGFTSGFFVLLRERYTFTDNEDKDDTSSFEQKTARIYMTGTALHNEFAYSLMADFVGKTSNGENVPVMKDMFIDWRPSDWAELRMGHWPTFFTRQFPNNPGKITFPDFALATNYFTHGRQNGASFMLKSPDKVWNLRGGIFNGNSDGEGEATPGVDEKNLMILSLRTTPLGEIDPWEESDLNYSQDPGLTMAVAYAYGQNENSIDDVLIDSDVNSVGADLMFKYAGFSLAGEFFYRNIDADQYSDSIDPLGFYLQSGYFLLPKKFELAARYSMIDCDNGRAPGLCSGNDQVNEVTAALNYYFWGNGVKATLAFVALNENGYGSGESGNDVNTNRWIFQMSSLL